MNRRIYVYAMFAALIVFLVSCRTDTDDFSYISTSSIRFILHEEDFGNKGSLAGSRISLRDGYDNLFFCIADESGLIKKDIRISHNDTKTEIYAEGLHEGRYTLLVLAIRGDYTADRAEIREISHISDEWLSFPADLRQPLMAEYFYSSTPFSVETIVNHETGNTEHTVIAKDIYQKRIVSRMDFNFHYNNKYVENAVTRRNLLITRSRFRTTLHADGTYSGETDGREIPADITHAGTFLFMPTVPGNPTEAEIEHTTLAYTGAETVLRYSFRLSRMLPNHIHPVDTRVIHPDDKSPVMYVTRQAYDKGNHTHILTDSERKEIYTDRSLRSFNTSRPIQVSVTDGGQFNLRFYSPRPLSDVTIKARIPSVSDEYFDIAYFDSIPPFADYYDIIPLGEEETVCRTESGQHLRVPRLTVEELQTAEFKISSLDQYFALLSGIKHGWNIYWGLYGGDPDQSNGAPVGNWMGIRPVHIRESVAFFLNFTYMIDMDDHERILRENAHLLYDDSGQPVEVERVLAQMRQERTIQVGLVYTGNGILGLGSPSVFGAYQRGWLEHYSNRYACSVMFHELGHVMGYGHASSFTYGPWAEKLMNNFYVDNLHRLPVDSRDWLRSASNPNLYN